MAVRCHRQETKPLRSKKLSLRRLHEKEDVLNTHHGIEKGKERRHGTHNVERKWRCGCDRHFWTDICHRPIENSLLAFKVFLRRMLTRNIHCGVEKK